MQQRDLLLAYIAGGLLAALLGGLLTWLIVRKLRARVLLRPGPPPRPAHEIALEKLDRLGAYGFLENADNRPFYFAVSEVIREYLGARFGFDSLELTTDELIAELQRSAGREVLLGRGAGLAVGVRPGEVREDLAQRRRGARHAGDGDPDRDVDAPARRASPTARPAATARPAPAVASSTKAAHG